MVIRNELTLRCFFNCRWNFPAITITPSLPLSFSNTMPIETTILCKHCGNLLSLSSNTCVLPEHYRQVDIMIAQIDCEQGDFAARRFIDSLTAARVR
jgi:hypothetical protein